MTEISHSMEHFEQTKQAYKINRLFGGHMRFFKLSITDFVLL